MIDDEKLIEQNKQVYDIIALPFAQTRKFIWDDLKSLVKYSKDGYRVLDLGCGSGRLYQLFADLSIDYVGVDQSEKQLENARKKYPSGKFIMAEMRSLPFEDSEFDVIYCIATFHHLPSRVSRLDALREMKRVLKPGGRIIFTNWNLFSKSAKKTIEKGKWKIKEGTEADFFVPWMNSEGGILGERYYYGFMPEELKELFEAAGFVLEEQYYSRKGETSDVEKGHNIVSVVRA
ncbi:MAG: methyltransferase domain-containing protein [Candidatus Magasanikbacteria bacterium]|nr:methyltransferase domain-containing protein [Candidatus Magasanikbacteria bacterium]